MRLSNYLPTRSFELVVHGLDIARAARVAEPGYPPELVTEVLQVAAAAAVLGGRGTELLLALTGRDGHFPRASAWSSGTPAAVPAPVYSSSTHSMHAVQIVRNR